MYDRAGKIIDRREMLRVKLKSLTAEAHIIRHEEHRTKGALRDELHLHRVRMLRFEARCTHLAYGFIRGRTLAQMENREALPPIVTEKVNVMLKRYGPVAVLKQAA